MLLYNLFMTLDFILVQLDRELERVGRLRAIVAGLATTSPTPEAAAPAPLPAVTLAPALPVVAEPVPAEPTPRHDYRRRIPASPSLKPRLTPKPLPALSGYCPRVRSVLQALLRELSARWCTGLAISAL